MTTLTTPLWVPKLLQFKDWEDCLLEAFTHFDDDWKQLPEVIFRGKPVIYASSLTMAGLPERFWHLISKKSSVSERRIPDIERCERLLWIKAIIQAFERHEPEVVYKQTQKRNSKGQIVTRCELFLDSAPYAHLVVLENSKHAYVLVTSYPMWSGSDKCDDYRKLQL